MTNDGSNQREFTRVEVSVRTEVRAGGRLITGSPTHSISMKGMSIQTPERLPVGTECEIRLILVDGDAEIRVQGSVVAILADGLAFLFSKVLGLESYEHLRNLVYYNTSDVEQVESEFSTHSGIRKKE